MKKVQKTNNEFPFINDPNHIYTKLTDENYGGIQVGHNFYEFELHHGIIHNELECDGLTQFSENIIQLEINLDDKTARETITHEILHCLMHSCGIDERNFDGSNISLSNEFLADVLAKQLMSFEYQNPGLLGLLFNQ